MFQKYIYHHHITLMFIFAINCKRIENHRALYYTLIQTTDGSGHRNLHKNRNAYNQNSSIFVFLSFFKFLKYNFFQSNKIFMLKVHNFVVPILYLSCCEFFCSFRKNLQIHTIPL